MAKQNTSQKIVITAIRSNPMIVRVPEDPDGRYVGVIAATTDNPETVLVLSEEAAGVLAHALEHGHLPPGPENS